MDDVNSMFSSIDELRKNGWIQTQPPADEVIVNYSVLHCCAMCGFLQNIHYLASVAKWLVPCALYAEV